MKLTFWGTRGSIPVPGAGTVRHGGNTTCLDLESGEGRRLVVDAGSGIRPLGEKLAAGGPGQVTLLITHLHWDHLLGFLFFAPAFRQGWRIDVTGWPKGLHGLKSVFDTRRGDGHFPVGWDDLPASIGPAPGMEAPDMRLGSLRVLTCPLNHPQGGLGFRFEEGGRAAVFLTDNELGGPAGPSLEDFLRFCQGADVLIHDAQFLPGEMAARRGWGHSDWTTALELARRAGVGRLVLTHHDPSRTDDQVDEILAQAQGAAPPGLAVEAASEGQTLEL